MKKFHTIVSCVICFMPFLFVSCASGFIYYKEVPLSAPLNGKLLFVSCQLRKAPIKWSITTSTTSGKVTTTHSTLYEVPFNDPAFFYQAVRTRLTDGNRKKLQLGMFRSGVTDYLKQTGYLYYPPYTALPGTVAVVDNKEDHSRMHPVILEYLNRETDSDYYLVLDGDIISYEVPMLFNLFEFSLEYEISLIVYDRTGAKKFSRHYSRKYSRIPGYYKDKTVYYQYLDKTIEYFTAGLNHDLELLQAD